MSSHFDVQLTPAASAPEIRGTRGGNGRYRINRNRAIVGTIHGGGPEFELRTLNNAVHVRKQK